MAGVTEKAAGYGLLASVVCAIAITPAVVLGLLSTWWVLTGGPWQPEAVTLPEAAATRDLGEAARLIGLGQDPSTPGVVRTGMVFTDREAWVTPLEAAVAIKRADMVEMLVSYGARTDPATLDVLRCWERQHDDEDVRDVLEQLAAATPEPTCDRVNLSFDRPEARNP